MDTLLNEYLIEQMYNLSDREVSYIIKYSVPVLAKSFPFSLSISQNRAVEGASKIIK